MPGSVIDNTQNVEFATYVAGQIARAAAIFNIDEVCVLNVTCLSPAHPAGVASVALPYIKSKFENCGGQNGRRPLSSPLPLQCVKIEDSARFVSWQALGHSV